MSSEDQVHNNPHDDVLAVSADDFPREPEEDNPELQALDTKLSKIFRRKFLAALTGRDYLLKRVRDALLHGQPETLRQLSPYLYNFKDDLNVKGGIICLDEKIVVPKALRDSFLDVYHSLHPGQLGMVAATKDEVWWPKFHRDVVERCSEFKACTAIGKNLKTIIPKNKFTPLPKCSEPNEEIQ